MVRVETRGSVIRMLGPIEITGAGGTLPLGGPRARRLLAALALRANRPVSVTFLIDAAWGDRPPATCRDQVTNLTGRLRHRLGAVADVRLSRVGDAYQLSVESGRIDVHAFEAALDRTRARAAADDLAGAAELGRRALSLWYGDALGGPPDGPLAAEAARLEELRLAAYAELLAAELALGRPEVVVGEATPLVRRHPFQERLVGQLMTALHATGRSAEALQVFRGHRRRLLDELGVEPDPAVRALERQIARETRPGPAHPSTPDLELHVLLGQLADATAAVARYLRGGDGHGRSADVERLVREGVVQHRHGQIR